MAKKDDMRTLADLEIKTEEPDPEAQAQAENSDAETVMRTAGDVGGKIIRRVVEAGEEALDRLGVNHNQDDEK